MRGIVVGIDGSDNSQRALDWAVRHAVATHDALTVIAVHEVMKGYWTDQPAPIAVDDQLLDNLRADVEELIAKAISRVDALELTAVSVRVLNGFAAHELIEASKDAELVVVGSRGGGGFAKLLVGSVSSQVIHHAACPVVVVPHER